MGIDKTTVVHHAGDGTPPPRRPWSDRAMEPGERLGPYRLLEKLGEGGFGLVFAAEQDEPVRRRVALKVLKPGMDSKAVLARFEAERQALALMDHPCVAKVFDAGTTERGLPYFAMEYVAGEPIARYCDRAGLTTRQRLDLFIHVCDAVQHAHQKGIIHRDLKPSNVLVSDANARPTPRVIDFGIAKAVSQPLTQHTLHTEQGQLIGTPEYMSPEQADRGGLDIDTRTDVYSLGVMLYELLTGSLPFDPRQARRSGIVELRKLICEFDPPRPSVRVGSTLAKPHPPTAASWPEFPAAAPGEDAHESPPPDIIAQRRRTDTGSLTRQLRGDLDWITMRAMEKDRNRRYDSPSALAADIRRHLNHEPVLAGPPSTVYRMRKFVRRNRLGVTAAGVVVLALAGGLTAASYGFLQARQQRDAAHQAEQRAKKEAEKATGVNKFMTDMLAQADPRKSAGKELTIREALDAAVKLADDRAAANQDPEVEAAVRNVIGITYQQFDRFEDAEKHVRRAYDLRLRALGPEHPETLDSMSDLGQVLWELGQDDEAEKLYRSALEIGQRVLPPDSAETAATLNNLGTVLHTHGKLAEARPLYEESLRIKEKVNGHAHPETVLTLNNLAQLCMAEGKFDEAEKLAREVLEIRKTFGDRHPEVGQSLNNLGGVQLMKGDFVAAEKTFTEAAAFYEATAGPDATDTARVYNNLGGALYQQKRFAEAEAHFRRTLTSYLKVRPENHFDVVNTRKNLGRVLRELQRFDEAEKELLAAHANSNAETPRPALVGILQELESLYTAWNKPDEAAKWKAKLDEVKSK